MKKLIYLTIILLSYSSCYEDYDNTTEEEVPTAEPKIYGAAQISGVIDQEDQDPVELIIEGASFPVEQGLFTVAMNRVSTQGQMLLVQQEELLIGATQLPIIANEDNYTNIKTQKLDNYTLDQNQEINLDASISLSIEEAEFISPTNAEVVGTTSLYVSLIEEVESLAQFSNHAIGDDGSYDVLIPSKALIINYLNNGERVYPTSGISFDIALEDQQNIYYLDESDSRWKLWSPEIDASIAYRILLVAEARDAIYVNGTVSYQNDPVKHQKLATTTSSRHTIYSSSTGKWANFMTQDETQEILALDPCNNTLLSQEINTSQLNQILLDANQDAFFENDFEIIDCEGEPVSQGILRLENQQQVYFIAQSNAEGVSWLPMCPDLALNLSVKRTTDLNFGPSISWINQPENIGVLSICEDHEDGFAFIQVREDREVYTTIALEAITNTMVSVENDNTLELIIDGVEKEVYQNDQVNISINDPDFGPQGYAVSCLNSMQGCGIEFCEISHDIASGDEWSRIYFEGTIWMQTISPPTVGNFKVRGVIQQK